MPFYKRDDEQLLIAPNYVSGPNFQLEATLKDTYTYPVQGWYWFNTLDDALSSPSLKSSAASAVTMRQARLAMLQKGVLDQVEAAITAAGKTAQITWTSSSMVEKTNPFVTMIGKQALGWTDEFITELFNLAASL